MVLLNGLEPLRISPLAPKTNVSTYSTTRAFLPKYYVYYIIKKNKCKCEQFCRDCSNPCNQFVSAGADYFAPLPSPLQLRSCPRDDCGFVPKLGFTRLSLPGLYQLLAAKPSNRLLELFDSVGGQWPHKGLDLFYRELCAPQLSRSV